VCVIAAAALFYFLIKPQQEAYKLAQARYDNASVLGNQPAEDKAIRERNDAIVKVNLAQQAMQSQMERRMPDLSFERRDTGMLELWKEQIKTLGPLLESFAHDKNMNVVNAGFGIQAPPVNPNDPIFSQDVLVFPLGNVQVLGSDFKSVMNNIRRWNNCRRLVMVGPPTVGGNSPRLGASYPLTCYIFPATKGGPNIPLAPGGTQVAQK
jgi:hypothetical protein